MVTFYFLSLGYIKAFEPFLGLGHMLGRVEGLGEVKPCLKLQILRLLNEHVALTGVASAGEGAWLRDFKYLAKAVFI